MHVDYVGEHAGCGDNNLSKCGKTNSAKDLRSYFV